MGDVKHFFSRLLLFLVLWILLSEAILYDPAIAAVGIGSATLLSLHLWPRQPFRLRWSGVPALALFFLWSSMKGGVDIAYRAIAPSMPLHPESIQLELKLDSEAGRVLLTWMISMMPGTAAINLKAGRHLTLHVVDSRIYGKGNVRKLEDKIARFIRPAD
jgi:multicomponent Na+:H+ antiporter subunit E